MNKFISNNLVSLIGMEVNYGQKKLGVEKAYSLLKNLGLEKNLKNLNYFVNELDVINLKNHTQKINELNKIKTNCKFNSDEFLPIGYCNHLLYKSVEKAIENDSFSLVIGGDHSIASGSIYGQLVNRSNLKLLWVDAHADINIPGKSMSNNYHGMPVSHILGVMKGNEMKGFDWINKYLDPKNLVYLGLRDLDDFEKGILKNLGIKVYTPYDIEHYGIRNVVDLIFNDLELSDKTPLAVSFDIDSCDKSITPGTGTPVDFGLTEREAIYLMKRLYQTKNMVHLDMVEINNDLESNINNNDTLRLGMNLIEFALGKNFFKLNN